MIRRLKSRLPSRPALLHKCLPDVDFHISGLRSGLRFDTGIGGKNLVEDKVKTSDYPAIALREALSGV
jgi:hypothetical protein